jgi:hypothetical protein
LYIFIFPIPPVWFSHHSLLAWFSPCNAIFPDESGQAGQKNLPAEASQQTTFNQRVPPQAETARGKTLRVLEEKTDLE